MLLVSFTNSFFFQKALYGWSERGMATQNRAVDQAPLASHVTLPPPRGGSESCGPLLHTQEARVCVCGPAIHTLAVCIHYMCV